MRILLTKWENISNWDNGSSHFEKIIFVLKILFFSLKIFLWFVASACCKYFTYSLLLLLSACFVHIVDCYESYHIHLAILLHWQESWENHEKKTHFFSKWEYFCQNGRIISPFWQKIFSFWENCGKFSVFFSGFSQDFCQCGFQYHVLEKFPFNFFKVFPKIEF